MNAEKQIELTIHEVNIINCLNNLDKNERVTFKQLSQRTGINLRCCNDIVEGLRNKDYFIVSSRKPNDAGIRFAHDLDEWQSYKAKRQKEINNRIIALNNI